MAITPKQQKTQQQAAAGVGLGRDAFVEGGGLFDDFDGTILEALFCRWDYNGEKDEGLFLALEIRNDEEELTTDDKGKNPFIQYYSAGKLEHFIPSDDGKEAVPVGSKTGLSKSCNAYHLVISILDAGIDFELTSRVDVLEGKKFHFKRKTVERDFKGNKKTGVAGEGAKSSEILCAEKYLGVEGAEATSAPGPKPGQKPAGPVAATTKPAVAGPGPKAVPKVAGPKPNGATAAMPDDNTQAWAAAYIIEVLAEAGGSHPKDGLAKGVLAWAKQQPDLDVPTRNKVIQALGNEGFLGGSEALGWVFDGATLTLA